MYRISETWSDWIREALFDEGFIAGGWEVGLAALPDPAVVGQFVGFMVIEIMIPGASDDIVINHRTLLPPFAPQEQVQAEVRALVTELKVKRDTPDTEVSPSSNSPSNLGVWNISPTVEASPEGPS
jgi:hypothetical protein